MLTKGVIALLWLVVAGWMAAIFWMSCSEEHDLPALGTRIPDFIAHAAAFFFLSFLVFVALQRTRRSSLGLSFAVVLATCVVVGMGMEFAQKYLTDTRHFSLLDILADAIGATLAFLLLLALSKSQNKGKQIYALLTGRPQGEL